MPRVILSSKQTVSDSVFLQPWIANIIRKEIQAKTYLPGNQRLSIARLSRRDMDAPEISETILNNYSHFAKVTKFFSVNNYKIFASIRDSTYQILVEFTPQCVLEFERVYRSRITSETVNCLFVIGDCTVIYKTRSQIRSSFPKFDLQSLAGEKNSNKNGFGLFPVLQINQASLFDSDQVQLLFEFPFIYNKLHFTV
ncbi:LOW QUALITY PROTEIN: telomerase subunit EST3 NDAI_0E03690 [Naumovozyma dairenensis CBS 421]|uniref:Telomere replication protein EST3 n=1 Tax=Naumovozyma dairenensis (strain ATCC 10597 / BCRC 20456 / CBS 421 / NBRC 0211 / NRRL Y-12639) TaxID=1071378 RepID=G0WBR6_NAUDC|nr:LOW QUALITY PROTEIN: hypothetical protein NDAI_0E03690 [Naumovozyma dairenensis CBS 421]CCD25186.1 hypothetical protein NDAI_0E03690 [Naumovozyma dairenensis CBS 421]